MASKKKKSKVVHLDQFKPIELWRFARGMMRDNEDCRVPSRNNMVIGDIPAFQFELMRYLEMVKDNGNIVIASPRGFCKSTTCSIIYPLYAARYRMYQDILIVSNSESVAIDFLRAIRVNLESNLMVLKAFGPQQSDKWTENHLILRNGVNIRAIGVGSQVRGRRPGLIILDDIETDDSVASEEMTSKLRRWINKTCINSLAINGRIIFVGTVISPLSIIAEYLDRAETLKWNRCFIQAYNDGIEKPGEELWPEAWPPGS